MPRFCAECGAQLPLGARFCVRCGTQVPTVESSADRVAADASAAAMTAPAATAEGMASDGTRASDAAAPACGVDAPTAPMEAAGEVPTLPAPVVPAPVVPSPLGRAPGQGDPGPSDRPTMSVSDQFAAWPDAPGAAPGGTAGYDDPPPLLPPTATHPGSGSEPAGERRAPAWPLLVGVAVLLVVGLIWAFVALRGGGNDAAKPTTSPTQTTGAASGTSATTSAANAEAQAAREAVGQVLDAGRGSRSTLVQGISAYCSKGDKAAGQAQMSDALQGRMAQLAKLNEVGDGPFKNVTGGLVARDKLKAALQASAGADQVYVQMAAAGTVCQGSIELSQANTAASTAKKAFLDQWNPIMTGAKLQPLTNDDI